MSALPNFKPADAALSRIDAALDAERDDDVRLDPLPELRPPGPSPFPLDALGSVVGGAARAIADLVQVPDALAGGATLAAAALAAQPHADVRLPHGETAPISLFIVTSAGSGDRKSAADAIACAPVEERRKADAARHAYAMAQWREERRGRQDASGPPPAASIVISRATIEGLHHLLRAQPHVGLFSSEGAELLGGHSLREERRSAGIAWLLKAWGAETLDALTRGDGLSVLFGRRVSLHVLVQPVVLRALLADPLAQGQGLLARCLIAEPATLAGTRLFRDDAPPPREHPAVQAFHAALRRLLTLPVPIDDDGDGVALRPRRLTLAPEARALWCAFYDEAERQQAPGGDLEGVRPWASKGAEHAARLAAVITMAEDHEASAVGADAMRGGLALADFYLREHVRLQGQSRAQQRLQRLHALLQWMRERGGRVSHADVLQFTPRPLRELKAEGLGELLAELTQRRYVRRTAECWEVRRHA